MVGSKADDRLVTENEGKIRDCIGFDTEGETNGCKGWTLISPLLFVFIYSSSYLVVCFLCKEHDICSKDCAINFFKE